MVVDESGPSAEAEGDHTTSPPGETAAPSGEGASQPETAAEGARAEEPAEEGSKTRGRAGGRGAKLREEIEALRAQLADEHDRLLRLAAEFDNFRKRASRQLAELTASANASLIGELLPVLDNLDRALSDQSGADPEALRRGVAMTRRLLEGVLVRAGLAPIEAVGRKFDPRVHEALMQTDADGAEPETVVGEVEKGYALGGKVLRPAKVIVSR